MAIRRVTLAVAAAALLVPIAVPTASAAVKPGSVCKKPGQIARTATRKYTCVRSRGKLVWNAGVPIPVVTPTPTEAPLPPVVGPEPTSRVIAFYYGWYGNPDSDGKWVHWDAPNFNITPPGDAASDYWPQLGLYSSTDRAAVAQHMAWLREAGVGVIALSYWNDESQNSMVKLVLDMAQRYGIKVAFHIEPAAGRSADSLPGIIDHIMNLWGDHPAFFRTTLGSPYLQAGTPHPLFFVWCTAVASNSATAHVAPSYWAKAIDTVHTKDNALVVTCPCSNEFAESVADGHYDGAYNYVSLSADGKGAFDWARALPPGALYIPSVIPGNSARHVQYPESTYVPRDGGQTYVRQWTAALNTGIAPDLVTITSFNEWHEGTAIEPAAPAHTGTSGWAYQDFGELGGSGYLALTRQQIDLFLKAAYPVLHTQPVRIRVASSSDWASVSLTEGTLIRPSSVAGAGSTRSFDGTTFRFNQSLDDASRGVEVFSEYTFGAVGPLSFRYDGGAIGGGTVTVEVPDGAGGWRAVQTLSWSGSRNAGSVQTVTLPAA